MNATSALARVLAAALLLSVGAPSAIAQAPSVSASPSPDPAAAATQRGLAWLVRTQHASGAWHEAGGYGTAPVAMTALAGMALLSSGSTPTRGPHWRAVRSATDYLLGKADPDTGLIAAADEDAVPMFGHGFATLFLASVHGMEEDDRRLRRIQGVLQRAVRLIERSQSAAGGWYYRPESTEDEGSVTVTQLQALRACWMAGIVVDKRTIERAVGYLRASQNADGGIRYRAGVPGESRPAITAAGIAALYSAGVYDDAAFVEKAHAYGRRHLQVRVDTTSHHFYAHLYWSQALYQRGGRDWDEYHDAMRSWLLERQAKDGSWVGDGVGPVYGTAIALRILQLPLALVPIQQR